jgi:Zn-dependent peptidase ImmA (M78 family)
VLRLPTSVVVLGFTVPITYKDMEAECWGESFGWHTDRPYIHLSNQLKDQPSWFIEQTLAHEVAHVVMGLTGLGEALDPKFEEQVARCTEHVWAAMKGISVKGKAAPGSDPRLSRKPRRKRGRNQ